MNTDLSQITIESDITPANYKALFKGIWTGLLISLIVHQFSIIKLFNSIKR